MNYSQVLNGSKITFKFQGKSGIRHAVDITDRRLAWIVQRCQDIPGYERFQYVDSEGEHHTIDSADVNDYLREVSRQDFTAKDFRTWAGTLIACTLLREFEAFESETQAEKNIVEMIKQVAVRLGNTPSLCRKCYVHPAVLECYLNLNGEMIRSFKMSNRSKGSGAAAVLHQAQRNEKALMRLLRNGVSAN